MPTRYRVLLRVQSATNGVTTADVLAEGGHIELDAEPAAGDQIEYNGEPWEVEEVDTSTTPPGLTLRRPH